MGTDVYISIEEKRAGVWRKINSQSYNHIWREGWGATKTTEWLTSSATAMGWDELPTDICEDTNEAMKYYDTWIDAQSIKKPDIYSPMCGYIDLGDIRIIFWWEY